MHNHHNPHQQPRYNQPPPYQQYPPQPLNGFPQPNYQMGNIQGHPLPPQISHKNQQGSNIKGNNYQFPGPNAALMQPPALNLQEPMDTNSQFFHQRGPMTMSNNQHSEFDTNHQMEDDPIQQAQIASMFWEQRCMTMLQRFQWFYQRFQILRNQHLSLSDEMQKMDSQQQWHIFQQHHQEFHEKIEEMEQELTAVLGENEQLLLQKKSQDSEGVWEQRYQQLLGNFKSLQQEMNQLQASGRGGVTSEQYRQLEQHCAELQYQYEQALNQLKVHREGGMTGDIQQQMNAYIEELQAYKDKVSNLHGQNVELQQMLGEYEHENEQLKHEKYQSGLDRNKYEQLIKQVEQKQEEIHSLQRQFKNRSVSQSTISRYEQSLQEKNRQIEDLRKASNERDNQASERIRQLQDNLSRQVKANKQSEQQISLLREQLQRQQESGLKVQNIQRKLVYANQQVSNLNETLKKKNQQLIQLRGLALQVQKLKQSQASLLQAADERDRLVDTIRKKGQQIQKLHSQVQKLTGIIAQNNSKRQEYSTRNLRQEIEDLLSQVRKHEAEIMKGKNIIAVKEDYILNLENQIARQRQQLIIVQQILQAEREESRQKDLKGASQTSHRKDRIKQLDYQFNVQIKEVLEKQTNALRKQNAQKQETIRQLQEKNLVIQSQLLVYEKQEESYNKDLSFWKQKQGQLLTTIANLNKKGRDFESIIKVKQQSILQSQRSAQQALAYSQSLHLEIQEHQKLIKLHSNTIQELQQQLRRSVSREAEVDKIVVQNSHLKATIQSLRREKAEQEERLLAKSKTFSVNNSKKQLGEQKAIGQLLSENEYLKQQIAQLISQHHNQHPHNPPDLNKRLNEFNHKLHMTINHAHTQSMPWQKQRNYLIHQYQQEIEELKLKLKNRMNSSQVSALTNSKQLLYNGFESKQLKEQVAFLKQKIGEQEERNKHLLTINEQLKTKINSLLNIQQNSTLQYYKAQFHKVEADRQTLKEKLAKAGEQNREFRLQLAAKNTKQAQDYEFRIMQLELQVQEQQRKITLLQGERAAAHLTKASYEHNQNINLLPHNKVKKEEGTTPKSSNYSYKQGIKQQMSSIMGNYEGYPYEHRKAAIGSESRGSRYRLEKEAEYS